MFVQWKENLWFIRCKPASALSVVTSDYKSSDFTEAMQDCTPEYIIILTQDKFSRESCGATVTGNFTWYDSSRNLHRFWTRRDCDMRSHWFYDTHMMYCLLFLQLTLATGMPARHSVLCVDCVRYLLRPRIPGVWFV